MATVIYDGTFAGSATSAGGAGTTTGVDDTVTVGTADVWTDLGGGVYHIDGNGNLVQESVSGYSDGKTLVRPDTEACADHSIEFRYTNDGTTQYHFGGILRRNGTNFYWPSLRAHNSGSGAPNASSIYKFVGGGLATVASDAGTGYTWVTGHRYRVVLAASGFGPTTVSINAYDLDGATPATPVFTRSVTDSTAQLQVAGTAGYHAWSTLGSLNANRVIITNTSALDLGALSVTARTATSVTVGWTAATGGTGTKTYSLYRHTSAPFTPPGTGALVGSTTGTSQADSSPGADDVYYRAVVVDGASTTELSEQSGFETCLVARAGKSPVVLGLIGDSITADVSSGAELISLLAGAEKRRAVSLGSNFGISGKTSAGWVSGNSDMTQALAAFALAGVTHVIVMLGTNDAKTGVATTQSAYAANMANVAATLVAAGYKVILNSPPYVTPGSYEQWDEAANGRLISYRDSLAALADNVNVFVGDLDLFDAVAAAPATYLRDGVHMTDPGEILMYGMWVSGIVRALAGGTRARAQSHQIARSR